MRALGAPAGAGPGAPGGPEGALGEVLRRARPRWGARDLGAAETKLARLGIASGAGLARALEAGEGLNERLRAAGLKAFSAETLEALSRQLGVPAPASPAAPAAPTAAAPAAETAPAAPDAPAAPVAAPAAETAPATPAAPAAPVAAPAAETAQATPAAPAGPGAALAAETAPAAPALPAAAPAAAEAERGEWSALERDLWTQTGGLFHPRKARAVHRASPPSHVGRRTAGSPGRVSVVTPTLGSRRDFHRILWTCFTAQSWQDKELVVIETYDDQFSTFLEETAKNDQRLVYLRFQRPPGADWSIGLKRNIGAHLASGEFIAHFDDDDIYAPTYLSALVPRLVQGCAQGVTLSSWYIFDTETGTFGFCDPVRWGGMHGLGMPTAGKSIERKVDHWVYGYGFSYVYRRSAALDAPFGNRNLGEDFEFFDRLRSQHGPASVLLHEDASGICLHTQHGRNTSTSVALWEVSRAEVTDLDVAELVAFDALVWQFPRKDGQRSQHIEDWTGHGEQLLSAKRRLRDLTLHTPYGDIVLRCPRGALLRDVLAEAEGELGALSPSASVLRAPRGAAAEDAATVGLAERVGAHCHELWLQPPPTEAPRALDGPRVAPQVRVYCPAQGLGEGSVSRVFHVPLAPEARCADLRRELPGLPAAARVFASLPSGGRRALAPGDAVPEEVFLGRFEGTVTMPMVVTREQAREVQEALKQAVLEPGVQRKLDELEERAAGNEGRYRAGLKHLLNWEVYPPLVRDLGLEEDGKGAYVLWQGIGAHLEGDLELNERWLELEVLMRNRPMVHMAWKQVNCIRRLLGLPELG